MVGAGPTGLTLAIELARRGVHARVIDAATEALGGSRGKGIQPRTQEIFDLMGVMPNLAEVGGPYQRLRFRLGPLSLRVGSLGTSAVPTESTPYPNLLQVPQFKTEAVLRAHLASLGVGVEFGRGFESFAQTANGVDVVCRDGERIHCAYVVGCDGGRSSVRKALGLDLIGTGVGERALLVGDVKVEDLDREDWHVWPFAKGGPLTLCPLPHTDLFQVTCPVVADLSAHVAQVTRRRVKEVTWVSQYRPQARMVQRYRVGRVFLAGDAAHVHPPAGGQGLNTGVQDAWNLGWKLASALRGGSKSILDTYEAERLPIAAAVLNLSKKLHVTRSLKRGALTDQLGLNYRDSSLSSGPSVGGLSPGDRMPDGRSKSGQRIFDALRHPGATQLTRADGLKVLVRPDGYIASIGADDVDEYAGLSVRTVA